MLVPAAHFTDFISVFVDVLSIDDRVITAAVYIAEARHIYLTGGVRASCSRLGFFAGLEVGCSGYVGCGSSSVLRSEVGTSSALWSSGSVAVPLGDSGFSGASGLTGSRLDGLLCAVGVCTLAGVTLLRRQRGDIHISLAIVDVHIGVVAVRLTAGYRSGGVTVFPPKRPAIPMTAAPQSRQQTVMRMIRFVLSFIDFPPFSDLSLDWTIPHLSA
jgi:hypothetical protein